MADPNQSKWYIQLNGIEEGPMASQTLHSLAKAGRILPDTPIRKEGMSKTVPAGKIEGLLQPKHSNKKHITGEKERSDHKTSIEKTHSNSFDTSAKGKYCAKSFEEMKLGFGWGNVWIAYSFFFGAILIASGVINVLQGTYVLGTGLLVFSVLPIGSGVGLLRRKRIGLHLTYVGIGLDLIAGVFQAVQISFGYQEPFLRLFWSLLGGSLVMIISLLWFRYFQARKTWFK